MSPSFRVLEPLQLLIATIIASFCVLNSISSPVVLYGCRLSNVASTHEQLLSILTNQNT